MFSVCLIYNFSRSKVIQFYLKITSEENILWFQISVSKIHFLQKEKPLQNPDNYFADHFVGPKLLEWAPIDKALEACLAELEYYVLEKDVILEVLLKFFLAHGLDFIGRPFDRFGHPRRVKTDLVLESKKLYNIRMVILVELDQVKDLSREIKGIFRLTLNCNKLAMIITKSLVNPSKATFPDNLRISERVKWLICPLVNEGLDANRLSAGSLCANLVNLLIFAIILISRYHLQIKNIKLLQINLI